METKETKEHNRHEREKKRKKHLITLTIILKKIPTPKILVGGGIGGFTQAIPKFLLLKTTSLREFSPTKKLLYYMTCHSQKEL